MCVGYRTAILKVGDISPTTPFSRWDKPTDNLSKKKLCVLMCFDVF